MVIYDFEIGAEGHLMHAAVITTRPGAKQEVRIQPTTTEITS